MVIYVCYPQKQSGTVLVPKATLRKLRVQDLVLIWGQPTNAIGGRVFFDDSGSFCPPNENCEGVPKHIALPNSDSFVHFAHYEQPSSVVMLMLTGH